MPLPADLLADIAARNQAAEHRARRDTSLDYARTAVQCLACGAAGIGCIGFALHTTNIWIGRACFWLGVALGNAGILFTLLAAYRRAEQRGDW